MGVNVDSFSLSLLQKQFQVVEVMSGDDDERSFFHSQGYGHRGRCAVCGGVCPVQKLHAGKIVFAYFHDNGKQQVHIPVFAQREKCFSEKFIYLRIGISKRQRMVSVSRHSADSKKNQGFQGADIFLCIPKAVHVVIVIVSAWGSAAAAVRAKAGFFLMDTVCKLCNGFVIEAYVGKSGEKSFHHQLPCGIGKRSIFVCRVCKPDQRAGKLILKTGGVSGFSTDPFGTCTASTSGSLLTLKTKHIFFHSR